MAKSLPLPKYHRVYLVLREQLREGWFERGLPGELALMQQFGVARVTVRRALAQLAAEGLIAREPGRGTRPVPAAPSAGRGSATHLAGLLENLVSMTVRTSVKVLDTKLLPASPEVARALALAPGAPVHKAVRVRSTGEGPISHMTTWVPAAIAQRFDGGGLAARPILLLLEDSGVQIGRAVQTISARVADEALARHLDVALGSALLAVRRLVYDGQERPVLWLHGLYRPDRYEYEMELTGAGAIDARVWVSHEPSGAVH